VSKNTQAVSSRPRYSVQSNACTYTKPFYIHRTNRLRTTRAPSLLAAIQFISQGKGWVGGWPARARGRWRSVWVGTRWARPSATAPSSRSSSPSTLGPRHEGARQGRHRPPRHAQPGTCACPLHACLASPPQDEMDRSAGAAHPPSIANLLSLPSPLRTVGAVYRHHDLSLVVIAKKTAKPLLSVLDKHSVPSLSAAC
jgi:hypothetical protein